MAIDQLPETHAAFDHPTDETNWDKPKTKWLWKVTLLLVALAAIGASGAALLPTGDSDKGPQMTHTIKRGNLRVTVMEQGTLESSENTEVKCQVRGQNTVIWVVEGGTLVEPGDELVRLDTLLIEEAIAERSKFAHWSRSGAERSRANVARAKLAIDEYKEGRFPAEVMEMEKQLAVNEASLRAARNILRHSEMMAERGYLSELKVEDRKFAVTRSELEVKMRLTEIEVLKNYTMEEELERLKGELAAAEARHAANVERQSADEKRRDRALAEHKLCVITATKAGLVIYPSAAQWKQAPDVTEGATVHMNQTLLLMPNLGAMQVKVGIHESMIDRIKAGLKARVTLTDRTLDAQVSSVATVTRPAGWWTGNVVKYDTIIELPPEEGLKPGMSAEVDVLLAEYEDVLLIPVAAVVETDAGAYCWVKTPTGPQRRPLKLGDNDEVSIIVEAGVDEGDEVILNPLALVEEAQHDALAPHEKQDGEPAESDRTEPALGARKSGMDPKSQKPLADE
jgi:HlyD family secretion protein